MVNYAVLLLSLFFSSFLPGQQATQENEYLTVRVAENGSIQFFDKQNEVHWGHDLPGWIELSSGDRKELISLENSKIKVTRKDEAVEILYQGLNGSSIIDEYFEMQVKLSLDGRKIELKIENLASSYALENIEYPAHILSVESGRDEGYIVAPHLQGILIPSRYDAGFMRYGQNIWDVLADVEKWYDFESGNMNMPWFGAMKNHSSILVHVITSSDCILHLIGNTVVGEDGRTADPEHIQTGGTRLSSLTPIWLSSRNELSYPRKMSIELVSGGYVGMAKKYREYAIEKGRYVTLKEKIKDNPEIEKIIGAPDIKLYCLTNRINIPYYRAWSEPVLNGYSKVNTTFDQVAEIADELKTMGVENCMILLSGWNRMGYDREYPDIWPPAKESGGVRGLKNASEQVTGNGYIFALQDNYDDFYPDVSWYDEKYILKHEDGSLEWGGVWDGGPCQIICPAVRKSLLDQNLQQILPSVSLNGYYFDVLTNTSHYECYDERHPVTRKQDLKYRYEILESIYDRGMVPGGERGADWAIPVSVFFEGLSGGGTGYHRGISYRLGLTVPLFYLVYHDCVVGYWQHGTPSGREDHDNHVLLDLLYAQPSSWSIDYSQWNDLKTMIKETCDLLSELHQKTAFYPMNDHRYLTEDYMVQQTQFEDGTEVMVNFGIKSYQIEEINIPPKGFIIRKKGSVVKKGTVSRTISYH